MKRALILGLSSLTLAAASIVYSVTVSRTPVPQSAGAMSVGNGQIVFRDGSGQVASVTAAEPGGQRTFTGMTCQRFAISAGAAVCLQTGADFLPKTTAVILDGQLQETRRVELAGIPSRARVSASGRMVSWTVFVTGDSYNAGGFSTWTGILDRSTGYLIINMENIQLYKDGQRYHSADVNYWGVTFAADDNRFYATVSTRGETYLVEGDYTKWQARTLRSNVECPSLSPDGTRLAFKKRVNSSATTPWRLAVLDLATMKETLLAETASIDDQAAWLDNSTVGYAKPGNSPGTSDIWATAADGSGTPTRLITNASSPNTT